jgi:APA family basic amino acid/polyamine antiporter
MVSYHQLGVADPISVALQAGGKDLNWLLRLTDVAAVVGLASTVLVTLYGQTRIFMRMSEGGMLPPAFGQVSSRTKTPQFSIVLCGVVGGIVAGFVPLSVLGELISIGTLLAFMIVSSGVVVLRRRYPDLPRGFKVPALPLVAGLAIVSSLALMATLPGATWIRLAIWAAIGICIYFFYAREHSRERMDAVAAGIAGRPEPAPEEG